LSSSGQATYEKEYNSGIGSNGLTSARHDVFSHDYASKYPESFDKNIPETLAYSGKHKVTDTLADTPLNIGKLVLSPTRTYAPVVISMLKELHPNIHGMVHCSGGAQTKVLHFIENLHIIKDNLFDIPPLFKLIHGITGTDLKEMYKVFNMGHRLEIYIEQKYAQSVIEIAQDFGIEAKIIGHVKQSNAKRVTLQANGKTYVYE
jgi:phosphoribosylformylglycinamidine cyclo-ligase